MTIPATSRPLKVLAVMPGLTPEAGAETSLAAVAPYLLADGIELHLAVLTKVQALVPHMREVGVVVHDLSEHTGLMARVKALWALVREQRPDLMHATLFEATTPAQIAAGLTRCPVLVTWANTPTKPGENADIGRVKLWGVRAVEAVLSVLGRTRFHAVTQGVADTSCREYFVRRRRVRVAERGRDPERFVVRPAEELAQVRADIGLTADQRAILTVGRQDRVKGHVRLIEAFDTVADTHPEAVLVLAGRDGSGTGDVQAKLPSVRHRDRVRLLGHRDDIPRLMQACDAVVCSSFREGAAGALIEAMASDRPIVTVRLDGLEGVLADGVNALVVDPAQLAPALASVLDDPASARQRADRALADFHARFTVERSAAALAGVYRWAAAR